MSVSQVLKPYPSYEESARPHAENVLQAVAHSTMDKRSIHRPIFGCNILGASKMRGPQSLRGVCLPQLVICSDRVDLTVSSAQKETPVEATKESLLWWRHPFYRSRWKQWRANWRKLARMPANYEASPADLIARLRKAECDPDVALRLAFLEASHKPTTQSQLAKDNQRQQRLKRKLRQGRDKLWKAMLKLVQLTAGREGGDTREHRTQKVDGYRKHILNAALELEEALLDVPLIYVTQASVDSLRAMSDSIRLENVDSLKRLVDSCNHELETLLWPRAVELAPGHELFTLVSYVRACSGEPNFPLITDLLQAVYEAYGRLSRSREAIEKQAERFADMKSIQPEVIEDSTIKRANSGELRQELLACYPGQLA
jgi:hypothetical protein